MDIQIILLYALLAGVSIVILYRPFLSLITPKGLKGFPALPNPKPIVGDLFTITEGVQRTGGIFLFIDELATQLGPNFQLRMLNQPILWLSDWSTAQAVAQDRSGDFENTASGHPYFKQIIPKGMLNLTGAKWNTHRRIMAPAMTGPYLRKSVAQMNNSLQALVALWSVKSQLAKGKPFGVLRDTENAAMDTICGMAFGKSWECNQFAIKQISASRVATTGELDEAVYQVDRPDIANSFWYLVDCLGGQNRPFSLIRLGQFLSFCSPAYRAQKVNYDQELQRAIDASRARFKATEADKQVFDAENTLDLMIGKTEVIDDFPDDEIRDEITTYLLAGTETTSATLSWGMKYLTSYPMIQVKLREEIRKAIPHVQSGEYSMEDVAPEKIPYLEALVYETLRHARVAVGVARRTLRDTTLLGQYVPKDTVIFFPTYLGLEESPGWFQNRADEAHRKVGFWKPGTSRDFVPERWLDSEGAFDPNSGPSLPFGSGIRGCFGKNLALLEIRLFFVHVNQKFFFAPLTEAQNSYASFETLTRHPRTALIRPTPWDGPEAQAAIAKRAT